MVGAGADNAHLDSVALIPSCEAVDDVDSVSGVQIVNGTFSVDLPDLDAHRTSEFVLSTHPILTECFNAGKTRESLPS